MTILILVALAVVTTIAGMFINIAVQDRKINRANKTNALRRELRNLNESLKSARAWEKEAIIDRILTIENRLA